MQVPKMPPLNLPPLQFFAVFERLKALRRSKLCMHVCDFAGGSLSAQALKMPPLKVRTMAHVSYYRLGLRHYKKFFARSRAGILAT